MSAEIATGITEDPLDAAALINSARRDTCGAVASFIGAVRNHDGGESVDAIEYSSHPSSPQILREIVSAFIALWRGIAWAVWRSVTMRWSWPLRRSIARRRSARSRRSSRT